MSLPVTNQSERITGCTSGSHSRSYAGAEFSVFVPEFERWLTHSQVIATGDIDLIRQAAIVLGGGR